MALSSDEFLKISSALERYHSIFNRLWASGRPQWAPHIPTARVEFDHYGEVVNFLINPSFWEKQTFNQKLFIICHECLHIIFNHGLRIANLPDPAKAGVALDLVVNHFAINILGFSRQEIDPLNEYWWLDKAFPQQEVQDNRSFEYYLSLLPDNDYSSLEEHSLPDCQTLVQKLNRELNPSEQQSLQQWQVAAGEKPREEIVEIELTPKPKWELVFKKLLKKPENSPLEESWTRRDSRMACLSPSHLLPGWAINPDITDPPKITVWIFLDTSGSCRNLSARFFRIAGSLNPHKFETKLFCFNTKIYPTTLESKKIYGGLGTSYQVIEKFLQAQLVYPRAVVIITDGYGDRVKPQFPERWYWLMSSSFNLYLPSNSHHFDLRDFE